MNIKIIKMNMRKIKIFIATLGAVLIPALVIAAAIQTLNNQTGQDQTFSANALIKIVSSNNIHTFNASTSPTFGLVFATSSLTVKGNAIFVNQGNFRGAFDFSTLTADRTFNFPDSSGTFILDSNPGPILMTMAGNPSGFGHTFEINTGSATGGDNSGGNFIVNTGNGSGSGDGGVFDITGGDGGSGGGTGGAISIKGGGGGGSSGAGGNVQIEGGPAFGNASNGSVIFIVYSNGSGPKGTFQFDNSSGARGILDFGNLTTTNKTFTFQNVSGVLPILEADQTFTGFNKFEAATTSTIYVGSSIKSGCIALGDSDGSGITYITSNDGALTASSIKPIICQ